MKKEEYQLWPHGRALRWSHRPQTVLPTKRQHDILYIVSLFEQW